MPGMRGAQQMSDRLEAMAALDVASIQREITACGKTCRS